MESVTVKLHDGIDRSGVRRLYQSCPPLHQASMAFLDKFRAGAQKAAIQATAFAKDSSTKVASGSRDFVQGFSLPGEADKAAKILDSFLGVYTCIFK